MANARALPVNPFTVLELSVAAPLRVIRERFHEVIRKRNAATGIDEDEYRALYSAYVECVRCKQAEHYARGPQLQPALDALRARPRPLAEPVARMLKDAIDLEERRSSGSLIAPPPPRGPSPQFSPCGKGAVVKKGAAPCCARDGESLSACNAPGGLAITARTLCSMDPELTLVDSFETGMARPELQKITLFAATAHTYEDVSGGGDYEPCECLIEDAPTADVGARGIPLSADLFRSFRRAEGLDGGRLVLLTFDKPKPMPGSSSEGATEHADRADVPVVRVAGTFSGFASEEPELLLARPDEAADHLAPKHAIERGTAEWDRLAAITEAVEQGLPVAEGFTLFYAAKAGVAVGGGTAASDAGGCVIC